MEKKLDQVGSESHSDLRQIWSQLQKRISSYEEHSLAINQRLANLKEQQSNDKLLLASIEQRLQLTEAELGIH